MFENENQCEQKKNDGRQKKNQYGNKSCFWIMNEVIFKC